MWGALMRGIEDARAERDPAVEPDTLRAVMARFNTQIQEEQQTEQSAAAQQNLEEGAAFQAENAAMEGVTTTASGFAVPGPPTRRRPATGGHRPGHNPLSGHPGRRE